ncbi:ActS/PrrB/RegB family redox-sensitive histidine kinase [Ponticaulis sp.]|uniref:ActS/PrrB/RegB family redox-sensitive histidine kinase n=1 Tax=Ponticaulis sp. TaxID=2020902 RepID=UPI000B65FE32|nr:ActS/PrrB/RegB family redox-sensitive histidine kinase [Ponticaulis sp.]MAI89249.1 two-component sensor histidine kinase [Ponticaulis sp.]OUY01241.1 MAG: two-component sensor histidine kinase [Hyphomonadaceae bacterium TMED5]|tara:strand:+ start:19479 stop:20870 length:1392 start_codon:yes stop_codon:yes gene_type:complete
MPHRLDGHKTFFSLPKEGLGGVGSAFGRLRVRTFVATRWLAIVGQAIAVLFVHFGLGFTLPLGLCLAAIALSAWLNVFLMLAFPSQRLASTPEAVAQFTFDILQVAFLIAITGGLENPFVLMIMAPVTIASISLDSRIAVGLALLALFCTATMWMFHMPLPSLPGETITVSPLLQVGQFCAVAIGLVFFAISSIRVTNDEARLVRALDAAQVVIAREQKLSALGALAAATAHELGTPLATIHLVAKEMAADLEDDDPHKEDARLLAEQADRCRSILRRLAQEREAGDILHARIQLSSLVEEAARPHKGRGKLVDIQTHAHEVAEDMSEPTLRRSPEILHALGAFIENAVSFADSYVSIESVWSNRIITITISDDGPGFSSTVLPKLGEPYISERSQKHAGGGDMGLGFFIAKTLIEQSGGEIATFNQAEPDTGAVVRLRWERAALEAETTWSAHETGLQDLST